MKITINLAEVGFFNKKFQLVVTKILDFVKWTQNLIILQNWYSSYRYNFLYFNLDHLVAAISVLNSRTISQVS